MKLLISTIFFILFSNIAASFSSEFRSAMLSVEDSFGKLVTDVVTDVRDTISCTLISVESIFAINYFDKSSEHYKKCRGEYGSKTKEVQKQQVFPVLSNFKILQERSSNKNKLQPQIPAMSILNKYIDKRDRRNNLENVKSVLNSETNRLTEVSAILRQKLDKMSSNVQKKFNIFELNTKRPSVDSVWNHIKLLYHLEEENKNCPDATEIRRTINEILNVLDIHENSNTNTYVIQKDKIKNMNNLENDSRDNFNIDSKLPEEKQNNQTKKGRQIDDYPRSFKDVAKKIINDKPIQNVNTSNNASIIKDEALNKTEKPPVLTTQKPLTTTISHISDINKKDYDSLFQSSNENKAMQAANQANKIIEDSKRSEKMLDAIFGNVNVNLKSVFDDPDSFNFG